MLRGGCALTSIDLKPLTPSKCLRNFPNAGCRRNPSYYSYRSAGRLTHKHYVDKTQLKSAGLPFKPTSALLPVLLQQAPHQPVGQPRENSKIRRMSTLEVFLRQEHSMKFGDSGVSILGMCTSLFSAVRSPLVCVCVWMLISVICTLRASLHLSMQLA